MSPLKPRFFVLLVLVCTVILIFGFVVKTPEAKKNFSESLWEQQVEATKAQNLHAPHLKDGRYFSPWLQEPDKNFLDVLKWKLFYHAKYTPEEENFLPKVLQNAAEQLKTTKGDFILWIGHNTFLVRINGTYWLTDPIFSKRALLPPRVTPPAITVDELNQLCPNLNIIISHNHYDHLDADSIKAIFPEAKVFVPMGLKQYVMEMNKPHVVEMDWWQKVQLDEQIRLTCLPAQHWSLRIDQGRNESLWASWMLEIHGLTLYFGGDSGYFKGFEEIGKKFKDIDYAFLATTAYHPRWFMYYQHMNVKEAVQAFNELNARYFIPTQWGTFPLGSEPPGYPGLDLKRHIEKNQLDPARFHILDIGQILPIRGQ